MLRLFLSFLIFFEGNILASQLIKVVSSQQQLREYWLMDREKMSDYMPVDIAQIIKKPAQLVLFRGEIRWWDPKFKHKSQ